MIARSVNNWSVVVLECGWLIYAFLECMQLMFVVLKKWHVLF